MPRVDRMTGAPRDEYVSFKCPGCDDYHVIPINGPRAWGFNGDYDRPTLTPSILARYTPWNDVTEKYDGPPSICHSYVVAGRIQFLSDCTHASAGKTVDLAEIVEKAGGSVDSS